MKLKKLTFLSAAVVLALSCTACRTTPTKPGDMVVPPITTPNNNDITPNNDMTPDTNVTPRTNTNSDTSTTPRTNTNSGTSTSPGTGNTPGM